VVALTAFAMKRDEDRAMEAGCDAYIVKPIDTRKLSACSRESWAEASCAVPYAPHSPRALKANRTRS